MDAALYLIGRLTAGERIALILFAVTALIAMLQPRAPAIGGDTDPGIAIARLVRARPLHRLAWRLIALSAVVFSPFHAAWLLGTPAAKILVRTGDALASGAACAAFISLLAACGVERGISDDRVRRGTWVNIGVFVALVGATCLTR